MHGSKDASATPVGLLCPHLTDLILQLVGGFAQPWHQGCFVPTLHQSCLSVCLDPLPTLQNNEPVPQVLKQVVNLSC